VYSIEDIYHQALQDENAIIKNLDKGQAIINVGAKLQKFESKTEILNCNKNGDYFQECTEEEYSLFFKYGWRKGCLMLSILNCKRKLNLVEYKMRMEVNTRKNDKHIQKLKNSRDKLLIKYSKQQKKLNKI
jgi:hypothetical protein|tara:strand:- start:1179 stop:1571 length:393 start_codon:yes stop_codon:yes gene_type:complete